MRSKAVARYSPPGSSCRSCCRASPGLGTSGQSNANGSSSVVHTWQLGGDTHYTLQTEISGGGVVNFGSSLPPSGILPAGFYGLAASAMIAVVALDSMGPETVNAVP